MVKFDIRRLMLYEFRNRNDITDATNTIVLDGYVSVGLKDFNRFDDIKLVKLLECDKDLLLVEIQADSRQTTQKLSAKLKT